MKKLIFIASLIPILMFCIWGIKKIWPGYTDDCKVEEAIEDIIEHETGIKTDLTPESDEAKV